MGSEPKETVPSAAQEHGTTEWGGSGSGLKTLKALLAASGSIALTTWVIHRNLTPPPPKICGAPNGPPVTASRHRLRDGRFLAYKEAGVPREEAKFKIVTIHGFAKSRHALLGGLSDECIKELGIYFVGFDRAGYGQSTPNPKRNPKSDAFDVQDLADGLNLGATFYVAATSMGGYVGYALLKFLPHRLAGMAMFAPAANYWWKGFPRAVGGAAFARQKPVDRVLLGVAHRAPWLLYWYVNQKWLPDSCMDMIERLQKEEYDRIRLREDYNEALVEHLLESDQQSKDESKLRDMRIMFGNWGFEPFELENPFEGRDGAVHIWQGDSDYLVSVLLQREVAKQLPWVHYHELPGVGHSLLSEPGLSDEMIRNFLVGKN